MKRRKFLQSISACALLSSLHHQILPGSEENLAHTYLKQLVFQPKCSNFSYLGDLCLEKTLSMLRSLNTEILLPDALLQEDNLAQALSSCSEKVTAQPANVALHLAFSLLHSLRHDYVNALNELEFALQKWSNSSQLFVLKGDFYASTDEISSRSQLNK